MKKLFFVFILSLANIFSSMGENIHNTFVGFLDLDKAKLPIKLNIVANEIGNIKSIQVINDKEVIDVIEINQTKDSLRFKMPLFDNEFIGSFKGNEIIGNWYNYAKGKDYHLPLYAKAITIQKANPILSNVNLTGNWKVDFSKDTAGEYPAVAEFKQTGNKITGTFLTETGDYRYLVGTFNGKDLMLSAFDGAHAFLFTANYENEKLKGTFYSGNHWEEPWEATKDEAFGLRDADDLTTLNDGKHKIHFSFPDADGNIISLEDEVFQHKVVIVQVLGSWCPNCMDESRLYKTIYDKYNKEGLEIVGLAFERPEDPEKIKVILDRYKKQLGLQYPILWAGKASKKVASETLPMLSEIISFPTSIIINKAGNVAKIHTGFAGPATSQYESYVEELDAFIANMLKE